MSVVKGIGSFGSTALLVSSMTGPGLSTIPALFQQSGWLAPVFIFLIVAFLSGCSALFVCEALSNIRGNDKFQAKVELTTIAQVYLGTKYHYFFQIMLFLSLQSVNVASIIIAAQTFDSMFIAIFKGTCGLGVYPGGWFCISGATGAIDGNSPFPTDDYYIFTFGYLLTAALVIPLGFFSLVENIAVQMTSFIVLTAILIQWTVAFTQEGLDTSLLPASGTNSTMVLGIVIFNYSFITTIPSWVNSLKPNVNIHRCMWVSIFISTLFYLLLGICGAMAYKMEATSDILAILSAHGSNASKVTAYLFPVCALITSIPVFTIVIRSNLLRGNICSPTWALFWSNLLPWFICIPLQTKDWVSTIQNWSSLFFQSTVNFILPFILYFISRKYVASVEPIRGTELPKDPILQLAAVTLPSPILQNPDNNDVRMFNPDDNYSISIRRSSIRPSQRSIIEQSAIVYSPVPTNDVIVPTIICSSDISPDEYDTAHSSNSTPTSPVSSFTARSSINGLGISVLPSEKKSPLYIQQTNGLLVPPPLSNHLSVSSSSSRLAVSDTRSLEIAPVSPSKSIHSHRSSILSSAFSFRSSSMVVPEEEELDEKMIQEDALEIPDAEETRAHEQNRFIAFHAKPWLNPFYLAIASCSVLTLSIFFMIIFDLTMLGLGINVFG